MGPHDDDLSEFADDPVLRALTGPATPDELGGEAEALAAFRLAVPVRSRRRYVGRLGVGGTALGIAVALSGGVAAAYTASLPSPAQRVAHDIGFWAAVPPSHTQLVSIDAKRIPSSKPRHAHPSSGRPSAAPLAPAPVSSSAPSPSTTARGARPGGQPSASPATSGATAAPSPAASSPTASASPSPSSPSSTSSGSPSPSPTPTPTDTTPPPPVPSSVTITPSASRVAAGSTVAVVGHLATASGDSVPRRRVWLVERLAGQSAVTRVASGLTGADGSVTLASPAITQTAKLRIVGAKVRSAAVTVVVAPSLTITATPEGTAYSILVSADGGRPGDTVTLEVRTKDGWTSVGSAVLDGTGTALFSEPAPVKRTVHYRLVLPRTIAHEAAGARFVTPPA